MMDSAEHTETDVSLREQPQVEQPLGTLPPAGSRQNWRRSAVAVTDGRVVVGTAEGTITAYHPDGTQQWSVEKGPDTPVVSLAVTDELVVAGHRGREGRLRVLSADSGTQQWEYITAEDVGSPSDDTLFAQPYVIDVAVENELLFVASRRFERDGSDRQWSSVIYAFEQDGSLRWGDDAERSVTGFDIGDDIIAVGYNRCPNDGDGLVVFDQETGEKQVTWTPTDGRDGDENGDRRVGDVAVTDEGVVVTSHADQHGYLIDWNGDVSWRLNLGGDYAVDGETIYSYPNHVTVIDGMALFVTGNTFAEETRDPAYRHPAEHTTVGVSLDSGEFQWKYDHGGFAREIASVGSFVAVPSAQQFRIRNADSHRLHLLDGKTGDGHSVSFEGIPAVLDFDERLIAVVEEPVEYHDEGVEHGTYQLLTWEIE